MKKTILVLFVLILLSSSLVLAGSEEIFVTGVLRNGTNNSLIEDTLNIFINITNTSDGKLVYSQTQNNIFIDDGVYHVTFNSITDPSWFLYPVNFTLEIGGVPFTSKEVVPVPVAHASFVANDSDYLDGIAASSYYETSDGELVDWDKTQNYTGSNDFQGCTGSLITNGRWQNGTFNCTADQTSAGGGDTNSFTGVDNIYIYNNSGNITFNGTYNNQTTNASIDTRVNLAFLQNLLDTVYVLQSAIVSMVGNWSNDYLDYINDTRLDNDTIIRSQNESWFNESILWENSTGTTKLKSSQDVDMQDGDINIRDTDNEVHNISRSLQIIDEMNRNITLTGLNGTFNSTSSNLTITTLTGNNIIVNIDKNESILGSSENIVLTSGTNASPIFNQIIYINSENPVLTKRTTLSLNSPSVAAFLLGENFTYVSAIGLATVDSLINGLFNRFLNDGSTYNSGFDINVSTDTVNISTGTINFLLSEVDISSNHSTSDLYVHIHSDGTFEQHTALDSCSSYNDGSSISNNKYFNVVYGITITHDGVGVMYAVTQNKPSTEYTKAIDAEIDVEDTINFFPPDDIISLAYIPIVRVVMIRSGGVNTIQTLSNGLLFDDLRGTITKTSSSPPPSGITDHPDMNLLDFASAGHTGFQDSAGAYNTSNFTADYEAEIPNCAAGEFTTGDGSDLTCDTPAGGGGAGDKWVDDGNWISPNATFAPAVNATLITANLKVNITEGGIKSANGSSFNASEFRDDGELLLTNESINATPIYGEITGTIGATVVGLDVIDTSNFIGNQDWGDVATLAGGDVRLETSSVEDDEINYGAVTLADFTDDVGYAIGLSLPNLSTQQINDSFKNFSQWLDTFPNVDTDSTDDIALSVLQDTNESLKGLMLNRTNVGGHNITLDENGKLAVNISFAGWDIDDTDDVTTAGDGNFTVTAGKIFLAFVDLAQLNNANSAFITIAVSTLTNYFTKIDIIGQDHYNGSQVNDSIATNNISVNTYIDLQDGKINTTANIEELGFNTTADLGNSYLNRSGDTWLGTQNMSTYNITDEYGNVITQNATCKIIRGSTATLNIC